MRPRSFVALALCAGAAGVVPAQATDRHVVVLQHFMFTPKTLTIHRGERVTFQFKDPNVFHNVTSVGKPAFKSSKTLKSGSYTVRFAKKGTYGYMCSIHSFMTGKIVVR